MPKNLLDQPVNILYCKDFDRVLHKRFVYIILYFELSPRYLTNTKTLNLSIRFSINHFIEK